MVTVTIADDMLHVDVKGMDKLWSLKSRLSIPLDHVSGAYAHPPMESGFPGLRLPGTYIPGVITAGTFLVEDGRVFWDVHHRERAIVIDLHDEQYKQLVVEVRDPQATVAEIWAALRGRA
ncbi:MAG: hypothetical protein MUD01_14380 [Chloroflexaceae bacterium]|jgi:hypothetical protein|nr:hypothetical protein [Chloroflexaceae bacterium]